MVGIVALGNEMLTPWTHNGYNNVSTGYMRSSIAADHLDPSIKMSFEIDHKLLCKILKLFSQFVSPEVSSKLEAQKGVFWQSSLEEKVVNNGHTGHFFNLKCLRHGFEGASRKPKTNVLWGVYYSLIPSLHVQRDGKTVIRWFLNVGSNPSMLLENSEMVQIRGLIDYPELTGKSTNNKQALIVFHTLGYWVLEDISDLLARAMRRSPKQRRFRWPDEYRSKLLAGTPALLESSYSVFTKHFDLNSIQDALNQIEMTYDDPCRYYIKERKRRAKFCLKDHLGIEVLATPSKGPIKRLQLLKRYDNKSYKSKLTFEPITIPNEKGGKEQRLKYTVSFYSRYFNNKLRAGGGKSSGFTVADFIDHCCTNSGLEPTATAFEHQYKFVTDAFNATTRDDFMINDLMKTNVGKVASILSEWAGNSRQKNKYVTFWKDQGDGIISDQALADELGIDRRTLYNWRQELIDLGLNLRLPLPAYILLANARIQADTTIGEKLDQIAIAHGQERSISAADILTRAVSRDPAHMKMLEAIEGNNSQMFQIDELRSVESSIGAVKRLTTANDKVDA